MEPAPEIRSLTEQILDEFLAQLGQEGEIAPGLIERLRRLAQDGKMTDSAAIVAAIAASGEAEACG